MGQGIGSQGDAGAFDRPARPVSPQGAAPTGAALHRPGGSGPLTADHGADNEGSFYWKEADADAGAHSSARWYLITQKKRQHALGATHRFESVTGRQEDKPPGGAGKAHVRCAEPPTQADFEGWACTDRRRLATRGARQW